MARVHFENSVKIGVHVCTHFQHDVPSMWNGGGSDMYVQFLAAGFA